MQTLRYAIVLINGFIAGDRAVDVVQAWQEWHTWMVRDPSGADAYRTFFMVNVTITGLSLVIAGLVWWLLRPRPPGSWTRDRFLAELLTEWPAERSRHRAGT